MANPRLLKDTVQLKNYIGEVNDVATYQTTIIERCYCPYTVGTGVDKHGIMPPNRATLYIFDENSAASAVGGGKRSYLPFEQWDALPDADKAGYWTIGMQDKFIIDGITFSVCSSKHLVQGTRRMWHFEVIGV